MGMDALGALRLHDERKAAAFDSFAKGLDDLGNLDTLLKDRNLTAGDERPGVFGGSLWKPWSPPKQDVAAAFAGFGTPQEAEPTGESDGEGFADLFQRVAKPELADVHRWAKLRGLNHDQATIDEKTSRPERDRQALLAREKMAADAELRSVGYLQEDIDNARKIYDNAVDKSRTEQGRINAIRREMQEYTNKGLQIPEELKTELADAQNRNKRYSEEGVQARDYLSGKKGQGHKPSQFIMSEPGASAEPEVPTPAANEAQPLKTAKDEYEGIKKFAATHRALDPNGFDQFFDTLGLDQSQKAAARNMYANEVDLNNALLEVANGDKMKAAELKKAVAVAAAADNTARFEAGKGRAIVEFLKGDTSYSPANAKKLDALVSSYNAQRPKSLIEFGYDKLTGASEAEYQQQINTLRNGFGVPAQAEQPKAEAASAKKSRYAK
jgi:hypothetical protein